MRNEWLATALCTFLSGAAFSISAGVLPPHATSSSTAERLSAITANIDVGDRLEEARSELEDMRATDSRDPRLLIQLARVELKTAAIKPGSPPIVESAALARTETLLDQALQLDPKFAGTWVMYGHLKYLQHRFDDSRAALERARDLGARDAWVHVNLGETLSAMVDETFSSPRRKDLAGQAVQEFEAGLASQPNAAAQESARYGLAKAYASLGDAANSNRYADVYMARSTGLMRAFLLHDQASRLLYSTPDIDSALKYARESVHIETFPEGRRLLANILWVKAGLQYRAGKHRDADALVSEARRSVPDPMRLFLADAPLVPRLLPALYALHAAGAPKDFAGAEGGSLLVRAAAAGSRDDIESMLSWGADPNFSDPRMGTALHQAVLSSNADATAALLAHHADLSARYPGDDGRTPVEMASTTGGAAAGEIRRLLAQAVPRGAPAVSAGTQVASFFQIGQSYRLKKEVVSDRWGGSFHAGARLIFVGEWRYSDPAQRCFLFKDASDVARSLRDMAIPEAELNALKEWFEPL